MKWVAQWVNKLERNQKVKHIIKSKLTVAKTLPLNFVILCKTAIVGGVWWRTEGEKYLKNSEKGQNKNNEVEKNLAK